MTNHLEPFWKPCTSDLSQNLWLPTISNVKKLEQTNLTGFAVSQGDNFQFQKRTRNKKDWINLSFPASFPNLSEEPVDNVMCCRKIRLYPNQEQKDFFGKCFGTSRYFYNKGIAHIKSCFNNRKEEIKKQSANGCIYESKTGQCKNEIDATKKHNTLFCTKHLNAKIKWNLPLSLPTLRPLVLSADKNLKEDELWQKEIPFDTRQLAINEAISAYKSSLALLKNKRIEKFDMKFKSKKDLTSIFHINHTAIKISTKSRNNDSIHIFTRRLKEPIKIGTRMKRWLQNNIPEIQSDSILLKDATNHYYLCIPIERTPEVGIATKSIVALDPGVKTFQTYYGTNGKNYTCGKIGNGMHEYLTKLQDKINDLISKRTNKNLAKRTRYNLRKKCFRLRAKIKNIVNDLHWKAASYFYKTFDTIILPKFESKKMTKKEERNIGKKTTKEMLALSHYKFRMAMQHIEKRYRNRKLIICTEEFTSKTCGNCGSIHPNLKGKREYDCSNCDLKIDRDLNGARNILLKHLTESKIKSG